MANNRMWLVNDRLRVRVLLFKHNGEAWCQAPRDFDMPSDEENPTEWRLVYEGGTGMHSGDPCRTYDRVDIAGGKDAFSE